MPEAGDGDQPDCFLGTMLFIDREQTARRARRLAARPRSSATFEVVDGLQRLTTLTILFCLCAISMPSERAAPDDRLLAAIADRPGRNSARPR